MKKHVLFLFATLLSLVASAHDFEVDGIYYNITSEEAKQAEVTYKGNYYHSYNDEYSDSITLPATVTYNGVNYSVTSIGGFAFYKCRSLTTITIPEDVTSIGKNAFESCSSLTSITIPESVTSIGEDAFYSCISLKKVINYSDLPLERGSDDYGYVANYADKVINLDEFIGDYAFKTIEGVHYLTGYIGDKTELTLPADYKGENYQIGERAFYGYSSLTSITIPEGVTSIGSSAFSDCSSLTTLTIPESVTSIGGDAFYDCSSLTAVHISSLEVWCNIDFANFSANPLHYDNNLYLNGNLVTELTIPNSVTAIKNYAFHYCSSLTAITLPENVTSIGEDAFYYCSSLTTINIPEDSKLTSIGSSAFSGCESLTTINIPEGVTSIGDYAFYSCDGLTAINIPEDSKLTSIGWQAFYDCSSLTTITIPESVTSIGSSAFSGCSSLKKVINYSDLPLQRGNSSNGYVAYYADRVINVDEFIGDYAFKTIEGVHYLTGYIGDKTELTLPADYKGENYQIGKSAFYKCSSLTSITIPEGVTSIGEYAFRGCSSLTAITIPEGVTSIGDQAFYSCSKLATINIPEVVTSIGSYTFYGCSSLKELTLGKGLKKIAAGAFNSCTALEKVTIYATRPPSIEGTGNAFFSTATYENATLYVPQGCIDKYEVMTGWSSFYTFEEMEGGTPNYLTLRQADNGEVGIVVDLGRTYKVRITAFEGWKIHSVTFNGEEVTAQLTEEGTFTTPALQADAVLNIAYEKTEDNTMVANTTARAIKVQGHRGTLRIIGATEGEAISVYTTGGTLVAQESAEGDETLITLPTDQVYIVTVADKVVKIGM